ncbi:MAG TPA: tetratricopeptide repeat protein [Burkholderiales bacterium]|nr:tetratricopeptide repeat protein [Burkholderiales bacterium]
MLKKGIVGVLCALPLLPAAGNAPAQASYPEQTVHILVGFSPGVAPDVTARLPADRARADRRQELSRRDRRAQAPDDTGSADWNNLMGYSLRKSPNPDFAGAEKFYDKALRIDPRHLGALEYSGELYLQTGDLARAEQRLAALDKACFFGCSEYSDLKKAIAQYKAGKTSSSY